MMERPSNGSVTNGQRPSGGHRPNTNLEDVSDWLTKIIIGVSLVQAGTIFQTLDVASDEVGKAVAVVHGDTAMVSTFSAFSSFCIVYFFVGGLYFGYLWTRLKLQSAIRESDDTLLVSLKEQVKSLAAAEVNTLAQTKFQSIAADVANTAVVTAVGKRTAQEDADLKAQDAFDEAAAVDFEFDVADQSDLTEVFKNASEAKRNEIFRMFRAARKRRGKGSESDSPDAQEQVPNTDDEVLRPISALLPIIGGLIGADKELSEIDGDGIPRYHANYAQRAYVYLKMQPASYELAIKDFDKAIEIRDAQFAQKPESMPHSLLFYELMRAKTYLQWSRDVLRDEDKYADEIRTDLATIMATEWGAKKLERQRNEELAAWWAKNMSN